MTREEQINTLKAIIQECEDYQWQRKETLFEIIKILSAEPPKMGHWIGHREYCEKLGVMPNGLGVFKWCSNCDCGIDVKEWHRNNYNYCPNCGVKMTNPQENTEVNE